jgi:hypothetical protein
MILICNFPHSPVTSSLSQSNPPPLQDPTLDRPQPMFFPQCERPSFTPTRNKTQNYSTVYFNVNIRTQQNGRKYSGPNDSSSRHCLNLIRF